MSAGNLIIRENKFADPVARKNNIGMRSGIFLSDSCDVYVIRNEWDGSRHARPGIYFDKSTVKNIVLTGNRVVGTI